jgi:hypothetical protein
MSAILEFLKAWAPVFSLVVAVLSLVVAIIKGEKLPPWISKIKKRINPLLPYIFIAAVSFLIGTLITQKVSSPPLVSLISISFEAGDVAPRRVDLRTVSTSGIPVKTGQALRLFDLWFSAPKSASQYIVQAEIYTINGTLLGSTSPVPLVAGQTKLGVVTIKAFNDGTLPTAWKVQQDWKDLQVYLITYLNGKVAGRSMTTIHLAEDGKAWFIDPPYISLFSIVYSVNDGPEIMLDLRDAETVGIKAGPGDTLTLEEIWYDSINSCQECTVQGEATFLALGEEFDPGTYKVTDPTVVRQGFHKLDFTPMIWKIPSNKQSMGLALYRDDETRLDGQILPLK